MRTYGLGAVSYALAFENKPKRVVVTDISDDRVERAKQVISIEDAKAAGRTSLCEYCGYGRSGKRIDGYYRRAWI